MPPVKKSAVPKSAAERMRLYRERMTEEKKTLIREKNKEAKRIERLQYPENKKKEEKELAKLRMRVLRKNERKTEIKENEPVYGSNQALGKAVRRVSEVLPNSPRKKSAVLKRLVVKFQIKQNSSEKAQIQVQSELDAKIISFYNEDSISRQLPGKKDCVTMQVEGIKQKVQKKILLMTVLEAFRQFKIENPEIKVGKSKFASLRPKNIYPVSERDQNVCCCIYHENFEMLVTSLKKVVPLLPNADDILKAAVCNSEKKCYMGDCDVCKDVQSMLTDYFPGNLEDIEVEYPKWEADKKILIRDNFKNVKALLFEKIPMMKIHVFIAKIQLTQIKKLKLNLTNHEAIIHEDFSENYSLKHQNEIMTAHWTAQGVTLFTAVVTTKEKQDSYVLVSDEMHHDKYAVSAFNKILGQQICEGNPDISQVHMFSDGAASQFKNRFTLSNLVQSDCIHPNITEVDWSFFGTAHGKGPVDGVGGTVKRAVWRRVLRNEIVINTAEEFACAAKNSCPNVTIVYVSADQVEKEKVRLQQIWEKDVPKAIPNIRTLHFFKPISAFQIEVMDVSPFLESVSPTSCNVTVFEEPKLPESQEPLLEPADQNNAISIYSEMYYAVDYIDRYYIGRILGECNRTGFWRMKFLHPCRTNGVLHFIWPLSDDVDEVHQSSIFFGPINLEGCGDFTCPNSAEIDQIFQDL